MSPEKTSQSAMRISGGGGVTFRSTIGTGVVWVDGEGSVEIDGLMMISSFSFIISIIPATGISSAGGSSFSFMTSSSSMLSVSTSSIPRAIRPSPRDTVRRTSEVGGASIDYLVGGGKKGNDE